ncbi:glycerol-3-phosphate dehydrogenase [Anaerobranca californiensis DSM 14826]|uniref:Glycerol-3-phosphate dehydrogenase n=1 Tax=Anaerobranca californiensis DSM 14826 TaxID=1120989 RepID=A0A1M6RC27_9FIRM|nr:NAD(P)/FAD-dependent oxidoreductase [Anaerobranca californiensis]SHK30011.1 glycerol-3-phosphate dehydrogenase [Anaerobranca californiensis DSM 14826]
MYDVLIIGAGIVGTAIARELSKYELKVILAEKENDIANGTTKANSAIVHAGYDALPGTLKAKTNVLGNKLYPKLCEELDVPFKQIGSFVVAFNEDEVKVLERLKKQGEENGVPNLEILPGEKVLEMEPNLSDKITAALYAPTGGIVGPFELAIALAENAVENGVEVILNSPVTKIEKIEEGYKVKAGEREILTKFVINCAGLYADQVNNLINEEYFKIQPNRGEYNLFDKTVGNYVNKVVFQAPTPVSKGVVCLPTVHGNFLIGPTADYVDSPQEVQTTGKGLAEVREKGLKVLPNFPFYKVITSFAGLRAKVEGGDFIIEEVRENKGFINVAGIDSPGLTAAPVIALEVVEILRNITGGLKEKENFNGKRKAVVHFMELSPEEKAELIKKDPKFGRVICRCESITEGEIVNAIHRPVGGRTLDGIKRRVRAGMGRCQGGFCAPRVMEILARELEKDITEIVKDSPNSYILTGPTKSRKKDN